MCPRAPGRRVFSDDPVSSVAAVGEMALIRRIHGWLGDANPAPPEGIGDDCAVWRPDQGVGWELVTVDGVCYGRHFDDSVSAWDAGRKLLARNISDIAAMGGEPVRGVVALWLAGATDLEWLHAFYSGIRDCALKYGVRIVGGDVAEAPAGVFLSDLTLIGRCAVEPVRRGIAREGDSIWVTGSLGGSLLGKHYRFEPRISEGAWLARRVGVKAMMDISDGLAKDLVSLVGGRMVELDPDSIPVSAEAIRFAAGSGRDPLYHALSDGEDYELAFVMDAKADIDGFKREWNACFDLPIACVGRVASGSPVEQGVPAIRLAGGRLWTYGSGYEHLG